MMKLLQTIVTGLAVVLAAFVISSAQISIPNSFTPNTRIVSADVNQNFSELGGKALNREGGTATGVINFGADLLPTVDGIADLGSPSLRFGTGYAENFDVETGLTSGTVTVSSTAADSIDTAGGINAGTGNVGIVGADGRIPALNSTYVASATTTTDWTWTNINTFGGVVFVSASPGIGTNNNYAIGNASTIIYSGGISSSTITGIAGGVNGRVVWAFRSPAAAGDLTLSHESGSSSAVNRITSATGADITLSATNTVMLIYDDSSQRWLAFPQ